MSRAWLHGCLGVASGATWGCGGPVDVPTPTGPGPCDPAPQLDAARAASEAYADPEVALAEGYVPQETCVFDERGAAMGIHYVRLADSLDQVLDVSAPEIVLYVPDGDAVRMVGVEYVRPALVDGAAVFEAPADATAFDPAPELFCRPLDGPMEGHEPGQPWHYDLHVWLYADNADGLYAQYNPAESCGVSARR